jgi:hypothetical protein
MRRLGGLLGPTERGGRRRAALAAAGLRQAEQAVTQVWTDCSMGHLGAWTVPPHEDGLPRISYCGAARGSRLAGVRYGGPGRVLLFSEMLRGCGGVRRR